jgi:TolB-like protein
MDMNSIVAERLQVIWKELRKRKVFQVALVYVLMAWGIMQVGELLFEALQVPEGAYTLLVILVLMGFPVAVVLAWAYEITPDGVRRDIVRELHRETNRQTTIHCSCGKVRPSCNRLAILPFRDMAPKHDLGHFCEGITEEIQHALCSTGRVEVVARAHSAQFRGNKVDIDKIQKKLGVDAVIEGSVRYCDDTYRISIQLVDGYAGTDIWSLSYELAAGREFAVQKKVAAEIANHTARTFTPPAEDEPLETSQLALGPFNPGRSPGVRRKVVGRRNIQLQRGGSNTENPG